MLCLKCYSDPCECRTKEKDSIFQKARKCTRCGGSGWEEDIARNDIHDPGSYRGACRSCGGKGEV